MVSDRRERNPRSPLACAVTVTVSWLSGSGASSQGVGDGEWEVGQGMRTLALRDLPLRVGNQTVSLGSRWDACVGTKH